MTNPTTHVLQSQIMSNNQVSDNQAHFISANMVESMVPRQPLRQHVQFAVEQYFAELEGEMPTYLYDTFLQELEMPLLTVVLEQTQGNQSKAAKILGLNRGTLRKKMQQYGLM